MAVLPVILFHSGVPLFSGGFVGVDVFFVISGYLITSIIRDEIEADSFSLSHFYERRIRRIFPALFLTVGVTVIAAFALTFPPGDLTMLARSATSTTFFFANYYFLDSLAGGYFSPSAESQPLLHTWSLAVEEQFYLVFPAMLLLLRRLTPRLLFLFLLILFFSSLVASEILVRDQPVVAFFSTPTRVWELLLGSLLSFVPRAKSWPTYLRHIGTFGGLILILFSIFYFTDEHHFPGYSALAPTCGAALIILSNFGTEKITGGLLRQPPLVFIGKISYPLYLWHWPILVAFFSITGSVSLTVSQIIMAIGLTFLFSILTWRFVEVRFRFGGFISRRSVIFTTSAAVMFSFVAMAKMIESSSGFPGRLPENIRALSNMEILRSADSERCLLSGSPEWLNQTHKALSNLCQLGPKSSSPDFILWGDSHADAIRPGLALAAENLNMSGVFAGYGACPPVLGLKRHEKSEQHKCVTFNKSILQLIKQSAIPIVILHGRWSLIYNGERYEGESGKDVLLTNGDSSHNADVFEQLFTETVNELTKAGVAVIIVTPVPEISFNVPTFLTRRALADLPITNLRSSEIQGFNKRNRELIQFFEQLASHSEVTLIRPDTTLCNQQGCAVSGANSEPLYYDSHHLSIAGATRLTPLFEVTLANRYKSLVTARSGPIAPAQDNLSHQ